MFNVQAVNSGTDLILEMAGALGREGGEMVLGLVEQLPTLPGKLVLNFTKVETINTAGLGGVLWAVRKLTRAEKQVVAFGLTDHYRKVFHVMGLTQYIAVVAEEEAALRWKGPTGE